MKSSNITVVQGASKWPVYSQHPNIAPPNVKRNAEARYLPILTKAWQEIERITGYRWRCTSYWRDSPSHVSGTAMDVAPDIAATSNHLYAVSKMSDPVLYKREALIRDLQKVAASWPFDPNYLTGLFIEPDHIHMQVFKRDRKDRRRMIVVKWRVPKPIYGDTWQRMRLPLIN